MWNVTSDVAIIIVTYNSALVIDALLDSLPQALQGREADVVVVDNSSTDRTREILASRSDCRVVASSNLGYSAGINRGIAAAGPAPAVLILNPDVRMQPGSIAPLLDSLGGEIGITCPRILSDDGALQLSLRREPTLLRALGLSRVRLAALSEYVQDEDAYRRAGPVDWALGAVLAVSRDCLDVVGPWDETYFLYSEETDYCLRAREAGQLTWFVPESSATHVGGGSGRNDLTHTMQVLNRVRLFTRRNGARRGALYYVLTLLAEASWVLRGHPQSRAAIRALLVPRRRPPELGLRSLLPR